MPLTLLSWLPALLLLWLPAQVIMATRVSAAHAEPQSRNVEFLEHPHRRVYDGYQVDGKWIAGWEVVKDYVYNAKYEGLDLVQKSIVNEGFFAPVDKVKIHLFSTEEALDCLKNRTILFAGDSYMIQFYLGLIEILTADPTNVQIVNGGKRAAILYATMDYMQYHLAPMGINVTFVHPECKYTKMDCLLNAIRVDKSLLQADALVINFMIHQLHFTLDINADERLLLHNTLVEELLSHGRKNMINWVTAPNYDIDQVPLAYRARHQDSIIDTANFAAMRIAEKFDLPVIDMFTPTRVCRWANCSYDGGHRSKFVNRFKAQLLLNNFCRFST